MLKKQPERAGQSGPLRGALRHLQSVGGVVQALPADLHRSGPQQSRHPHLLLQEGPWRPLPVRRQGRHLGARLLPHGDAKQRRSPFRRRRELDHLRQERRRNQPIQCGCP